MKMAFLIEGTGVTPEQYDQIVEKLNLGGKAAPGGIFHIAGPMEGGMRVVDVWESREAFIEFSKTLLPIIEKTGVNVPEPTILPAYYVYVGQTEAVPA